MSLYKLDVCDVNYFSEEYSVFTIKKYNASSFSMVNKRNLLTYLFS